MRSTVDEDGRRVGHRKGASEVILARSSLSESEREHGRGGAAARADSGERVLGIARGDDEARTGSTSSDSSALWDPPRAEAPARCATREPPACASS